jgi:hypothetical protein
MRAPQSSIFQRQLADPGRGRVSGSVVIGTVNMEEYG